MELMKLASCFFFINKEREEVSAPSTQSHNGETSESICLAKTCTHALLDTLNKQSTFFMRNFSRTRPINNDVPGLLIDQEKLDLFQTNSWFIWSGMIGDCLRLTVPLWELIVRSSGGLDESLDWNKVYAVGLSGVDQKFREVWEIMLKIE